MSYTHITRDDRVSLAALLRAGNSMRECGRILKKDPGSISREIARNKGEGGYKIHEAQGKTKERRIVANHRFRKISGYLAAHIVRNLKNHRSPEQIAGKLRRRFKKTIVCHETIYHWIYLERPHLKKCLRSKKGRYRRRGGTLRREKTREEAKKRRIDTRPAIVETRERIGDWEGDTIVGKGRKQRILTYVERKSGYLMADVLREVSAEKVKEKTVRRFSKLPRSKRKTVTYDNGTEFSDHERIEMDTRMTVYFAHPYHSWERGTNENTNGLLREFFPKKMSFATLTQDDLDRAVKNINDRPRKRLNYFSPREIFMECCALD